MWSGETVKWIDIELTSFCNIKCPGCFRQVKKKKVENILNKNSLSFEQLKKWITRKNFPNLTLLNFCGSIDEPTLHPELLDIVSHFNKFSEINIATNGSTKTIKFWQKLGEEKISVFFGLDGIDQKSIEKYRVGSRFDRIIKNWRAFIKSGGKATWQFIAFDHNEHLIDEAKKIAKNEGFENFRLIYSHRNENQESKKKQRSEEKRVSRLLRKSGFIPQLDPTEYDQSNKRESSRSNSQNIPPTFMMAEIDQMNHDAFRSQSIK